MKSAETLHGDDDDDGDDDGDGDVLHCIVRWLGPTNGIGLCVCYRCLLQWTVL